MLTDCQWVFFFFAVLRSITLNPEKKWVWFTRGTVVSLSDPAPHHPASHYEERLWTVSLCRVYEPVFLAKQKAPQWQRNPQRSATIQPSLQTEWVPTHSCSSHTAAVADNTGKKGCDARRSSRSWKRSWKAQQFRWEGGRYQEAAQSPLFRSEAFEVHTKGLLCGAEN